ncbi:MAG: hypothetical protein ACP5IA_14860, partial [Sediminispirochaetaceae bacterium]
NNWQENVRKILQTDEIETAGEMDRYIQDMESESDEDIEGEMVPIIDVGGIEPVIAVNEEDGESINLIDMEEDIEPPEEEKDEEEPEKIKAAFAAETGDNGASKESAAASRDGQGGQQDFRQPPRQTPQYPPQYPQQQQYPPYPPYPPPQFPYQYPPQYQPTPYPGQQDSQTAQQAPQSPPPQGPPPQGPPPQAPPPRQAPPQPVQTQQPQYMPYPVYQPAEEPNQPEPAEISSPEPSGSEQIEPEPSEPEPLEQFYPQDPDTIEDAIVDDTGLEPVEGSGDEQAAGSNIDQNSAQGLFDYLTGLVEYLPDEDRTHYEESDMRLRVEALRTRLKGRGGLHSMAEQLKRNGRRREAAAPGPSQGLLQKSDMLKPDTVRSAFSYLQNLSEELPNPAIGVALKQKMHDIIEKLRK